MTDEVDGFPRPRPMRQVSCAGCARPIFTNAGDEKPIFASDKGEHLCRFCHERQEAAKAAARREAELLAEDAEAERIRREGGVT